MYNILWGRYEMKSDDFHPAHKHLRKLARAQGYVSVAGFQEFAKVELNAKLYFGRGHNITGIVFEREEDRTLFALGIEHEQ